MTITASLSKSIPIRADLLAATAALAHITANGPHLDQVFPINKVAIDYTYLLIPRRSIKHAISSTRRHCDRVAPQAKSP
jgi:hypothetical protein